MSRRKIMKNSHFNINQYPKSTHFNVYLPLRLAHHWRIVNKENPESLIFEMSESFDPLRWPWGRVNALLKTRWAVGRSLHSDIKTSVILDLSPGVHRAWRKVLVLRRSTKLPLCLSAQNCCNSVSCKRKSMLLFRKPCTKFTQETSIELEGLDSLKQKSLISHMDLWPMN